MEKLKRCTLHKLQEIGKTSKEELTNFLWKTWRSLSEHVEKSLQKRLLMGCCSMLLSLGFGYLTFLGGGLLDVNQIEWHHTLIGLLTIVPIFPILAFVTLCRAISDFTKCIKLWLQR